MNGATIRLDKLLWYRRFAASRSLAQRWVLGGHMRLNGQRVTWPAQPVEPGDVLTLPLPDRVRVVTLLAIPQRRGPAAEARELYRDSSDAIATDSQNAAVP